MRSGKTIEEVIFYIIEFQDNNSIFTQKGMVIMSQFLTSII